MRLVLHVGMAKTGSSTLQSTLRANDALLRRAGVLYPKGGNDRLRYHQLLLCLAVPPSRLPRMFGDIRELTQDEATALGEQFWADVLRQVETAKPHTLILSYESIFYLWPEDLEGMKQRFAELTDDIGVVAYIRHPSSHYVSTSQQRVKATDKIASPGRYRIAIKKHLERLESVFGHDIGVRAFDREVLEADCIVQDFLHHHVPGGDELRRSVEVLRSNTSMSAEAMCIMQDFRRYAFADEPDVFSPESQRVIGVLRDLTLPSTPPKLRPGIADLITRNHQEDLDWLFERYGTTFPSVTDGCRADASEIDEVEAEIAGSSSLRELLEVDAQSVDRTLFELVKVLSSRAAVPA